MVILEKAKNLRLQPSAFSLEPLLQWFAKNARDLPWRRTRDPYAIWISEIMLQQTQVKTVIPYWERWMRELPDVRALARAQPQRVLKLWEGLGYYIRARNLHKAAQLLVAESGGKFPDDFEAVLALPGIGRYTAGAICSIAFNQPVPALDGNVTRVLARVFGISGDVRKKSTDAQLWKLAGDLVSLAASILVNDKLPITNYQLQMVAPLSGEPFVIGNSSLVIGHCHGTQTSGKSSALNQALMELGATVCTARQPQCSACPLRSQCVAYRTGQAGRLPRTGRRIPSTARRFAAFVVEHQGRFLVRQRPAGVINAHLWEFPNIELTVNDTTVKQAARSALNFSVAAVQPLGVIKHTITRYRITLEVYETRLKRRPPATAKAKGSRLKAKGRWLAWERLHALPFTSAHRKILNILEARKDLRS